MLKLFSYMQCAAKGKAPMQRRFVNVHVAFPINHSFKGSNEPDEFQSLCCGLQEPDHSQQSDSPSSVQYHLDNGCVKSTVAVPNAGGAMKCLHWTFHCLWCAQCIGRGNARARGGGGGGVQGNSKSQSWGFEVGVMTLFVHCDHPPSNRGCKLEAKRKSGKGELDGWR